MLGLEHAPENARAGMRTSSCTPILDARAWASACSFLNEPSSPFASPDADAGHSGEGPALLGEAHTGRLDSNDGQADPAPSPESASPPGETEKERKKREKREAKVLEKQLHKKSCCRRAEEELDRARDELAASQKALEAACVCACLCIDACACPCTCLRACLHTCPCTCSHACPRTCPCMSSVGIRECLPQGTGGQR